MDQRIVKGQETKDKIKASAIQIIAKEGTKGLSAKKIAIQAGISKSAIFHHFPSTDDLLHNLLNDICIKMTNGLVIHESMNLEDFLYELGKLTFQLKGSELDIYRALFSYYYDALFDENFYHIINNMKNQLKVYITDSIFTITNIRVTDTLAENLVIDLDGLGLHYLLEPDSQKYMALWEEKTQMYCKTILN